MPSDLHKDHWLLIKLLITSLFGLENRSNYSTRGSTKKFWSSASSPVASNFASHLFLTIKLTLRDKYDTGLLDSAHNRKPTVKFEILVR